MLVVLVGVQLCACGPPRQVVEISFTVEYAGDEISCDDTAIGVALTDMRLYIHDLSLVDRSGNSVDVELIPDTLWQNEAVALLDFEDGSGSCSNGTEQTNRTVRGRYFSTDAAIDGVNFKIGLPENINHDDPMRAAPPLSYTSMHWQWASGYKFLSAGIETESDGFWMHLGSSRCTGTIGKIEGCKSSNRPAVSLTGFDPDVHIVAIDLAHLFHGIDLTDGTITDCSSGPIEAACVEPFNALRIDTATGQSVGTSPVFERSRNR